MAQMLQYQRVDGRIVGVWTAPHVALLQQQEVENHPTWGYLLTDVMTDAQTLMDRHYVIGDTVFHKTILTLAGTPTPFDADGVAVCTVSVTPFVGCTLRVNGTTHTLTVGDETLDITSDTPETFVISLEPMGGYWAAPITVEAS